MNYRAGILLLGISSTAFPTSMGEKSSVDGDSKYPVNFSGTIIARNGSKFEVDNIAIGGRYKQIPVYDEPTTFTQKGLLTTDPRDQKINIVTKVDLAEVDTIRVDDPLLWVYQKEKTTSTVEFIEIIVVFKKGAAETTSPEKRYLMDLRTKITCDELNEVELVEKIIPFSAIMSLTIKDYRHRDVPSSDASCVRECKYTCSKKKTPAQDKCR
jgi:hypothetical protein